MTPRALPETYVAGDRPRLALDFDGVVYPGGAFKGALVLDQKPRPGAIKFIEDVCNIGWEVNIFTSRLCRENHKTYDNSMDWKVIACAIENYLTEWGLSPALNDQVLVYPPELGKPSAWVILDDHAHRFFGHFPTMESLQAMEPYWMDKRKKEREKLFNEMRFSGRTEPFNFKLLQKEMSPWQQHNFPGRSTWQPIMGLIEELGEWSVTDEGSPEEKDGIADIMIFMADATRDWGIDLQSVVDGACVAKEVYEIVPGWEDYFHVTKLLFAVGKVNHHYLKSQQGIRGDWEHHKTGIEMWLKVIVALLLDIVGGKKELTKIVEDTWAKVRDRDWQNNPKKADKVVEENQA